MRCPPGFILLGPADRPLRVQVSHIVSYVPVSEPTETRATVVATSDGRTEFVPQTCDHIDGAAAMALANLAYAQAEQLAQVTLQVERVQR